MIDSDGFRLNVGIVICNPKGQLLWAKRIGQSSWQFPPGGIKENESAEEALYRELEEEVGLDQQPDSLLHQTEDWLHYRIPAHYIRRHKDPLCIGQNQKWIVLGLEGDEESIVLSKSGTPEFDDWRWVNYWYPVEQFNEFKRDGYRSALEQLQPPRERYVALSKL